MNDFPKCLPQAMCAKLICKALEFKDNFRVKTNGCFWCSSWLLPQSLNLNNDLDAISIFWTLWIAINGCMIHMPVDLSSDLADLGFKFRRIEIWERNSYLGIKNRDSAFCLDFLFFFVLQWRWELRKTFFYCLLLLKKKE